MEAITELHDNIMFYLVIILFGVAWIIISIKRNYVINKSPISNKYLNHGKCVPIQKYFNVNYLINQKRLYSSEKKELSPVKKYDNAFLMNKMIISENKGKSGIYMITNIITGNIYVGQSIDLSKRFIKYFCHSYIKSKESLIISRALIKYGYSNFSVYILEYCDKSHLIQREQYYLDKLNPEYNILRSMKIAGSSRGYKHSQDSKDKTSKALKDIYIGIKSPLYGKTHTEETKKKMSLQKKGINNPLYGITHNDKTKEIIRNKAINRKHSIETIEKISKSHGNPVNIYEKFNSEGFKLIGTFFSARRAAKLLCMSGSTVIKYMNSGEVFKDRYKFSRGTLK